MQSLTSSVMTLAVALSSSYHVNLDAIDQLERAAFESVAKRVEQRRQRGEEIGFRVFSADSPEEQRIRAALGGPSSIPEGPMYLQDLIELVGQQHEISVMIATDALKDEGIRLDEPVEVPGGNGTLHSKLAIILKP